MLRTTRLPNELLNKTGKQIEVRIGSPIPAEKINRIPDDAQATRYLRASTYLLSARRGPHERKMALPALPALPGKAFEPIASGTPSEFIADEVYALGSRCNLAENGGFTVFAAQSSQLHHTLREIGRLREITFREAGEGTGKD